MLVKEPLIKPHTARVCVPKSQTPSEAGPHRFPCRLDTAAGRGQHSNAYRRIALLASHPTLSRRPRLCRVRPTRATCRVWFNQRFPDSTCQSCGNSSILVFRKNRPRAVIPGPPDCVTVVDEAASGHMVLTRTGMTATTHHSTATSPFRRVVCGELPNFAYCQCYRRPAAIEYKAMPRYRAVSENFSSSVNSGASAASAHARCNASGVRKLVRRPERGTFSTGMHQSNE